MKRFDPNLLFDEIERLGKMEAEQRQAKQAFAYWGVLIGWIPTVLAYTTGWATPEARSPVGWTIAIGLGCVIGASIGAGIGGVLDQKLRHRINSLCFQQELWLKLDDTFKALRSVQNDLQMLRENQRHLETLMRKDGF